MILTDLEHPLSQHLSDESKIGSVRLVLQGNFESIVLKQRLNDRICPLVIGSRAYPCVVDGCLLDRLW